MIKVSSFLAAWSFNGRHTDEWQDMNELSAATRTLDANEAVASVAYRASDVIAIYPITPASAMGELADAWSADHRANLSGSVPKVVEMQSEGGAAGALRLRGDDRGAVMRAGTLGAVAPMLF